MAAYKVLYNKIDKVEQKFSTSLEKRNNTEAKILQLEAKKGKVNSRLVAAIQLSKEIPLLI